MFYGGGRVSVLKALRFPAMNVWYVFFYPSQFTLFLSFLLFSFVKYFQRYRYNIYNTDVLSSTMKFKVLL